MQGFFILPCPGIFAGFSTTFLPSLEQASGQLIGHTLLSCDVDMSIDVSRHFNIRMAHPFLYIFQRESGVQQLRRRARSRASGCAFRRFIVMNKSLVDVSLAGKPFLISFWLCRGFPLAEQEKDGPELFAPGRLRLES